MKRYAKELIIFVLQLLTFYVLPLFAGPTDIMGLVLLIIIATFVLALVIGIISKNKMRYLYPIITAVVFLPTVPIYYYSQWAFRQQELRRYLREIRSSEYG